ncbi:MAG: hypothetical protein QOD77_79 [Thermoplasmata archaeon]|nr:hypothetical protein [Thermoplasmata archaeon]
MRAWAAAVIVLLAGCTAPPPPDSSVLPAIPGGLLPGEAGEGFFLLPHAGGELAFGVAGTAHIELYGPDDVRLGSLTLGGLLGAEPVRLQRPPGAHVLHVASLEGKLRVESGGAEARLHPLILQAERVVLAEGQGSLVPPLPFAFGAPVATSLNVSFSRAPVGLQALVLGSFSEVRVEVDGVGRAYEAAASSTNPFVFTGDRQDLTGSFDPEGVRDGNLTAHVSVVDLQGTVLLEATTYVRSLPPAALPSAPATQPPTFPYGFLPRDKPVLFQVAPDARALTLDGGPDGALVALFGPADQRLGAYGVAANGRLAIAVPEGGDYVAALLTGNATLGADAAPAAFDFRPLAVTVVTAPDNPAGESDSYAAAEQPLQPAGVVYYVEATPLAGRDLLPVQCSDSTGVRLRQGGEGILAWFAEAPMAPAAASSALLDGSPLMVWHDGQGDDGCGRAGVAAHGYTR